MSEIKLPQNSKETATSEPLKGRTPGQIRDLASKYDSDEALAAIFAGVFNKTDWLGLDIGDPENDKEDDNRFRLEHEDWWTLREELFSEIVRRSQKEHAKSKTPRITIGKGMWYVVKTFMERHGFREDAGWWLPSGLRERCGR